MVENLTPNQILESAHRKINERINGFSVPTIHDAVLACTENVSLTATVVQSCTAALRYAYFSDFAAEISLRVGYGETDREYHKEIYSDEAQKQLALCYQGLPDSDRQDLEEIRQNVVQFFDYERKVWEKVKRGERVDQQELMNVWELKSSDALFYGRLIQSFIGKDFSPVLYANMRLLDIRGDLKDIMNDFTKNSPNMIIAMLANSIGIDRIPEEKTGILDTIRTPQIQDQIIDMMDLIYGIVHGHDQVIETVRQNNVLNLKQDALAQLISDFVPRRFNGYLSIRRRMDENFSWIIRRINQSE